jgi:hypothetical protein
MTNYLSTKREFDDDNNVTASDITGKNGPPSAHSITQITLVGVHVDMVL